MDIVHCHLGEDQGVAASGADNNRIFRVGQRSQGQAHGEGKATPGTEGMLFQKLLKSPQISYPQVFAKRAVIHQLPILTGHNFHETG
jgi:hypothetical protein